MPDDIVEFQWNVHEGGYRWIDTTSADAAPKRGPFLTDNRPIGARGFNVKRYKPLSIYSGLFRTFADTEPTSASIKAFADRFGLLGGDVATMVVLPDHRKGRRQLVGVGERSREWRREILTMRQMVDLWGKARNGDVEGLAPHIQWRKGEVYYFSHPDLGPKERRKRPGVKTVARISARSSYELSRVYPNRDLVGPAFSYVQQAVNDRLKDCVSSRLLWDPPHSGLKLHVVPDSLLGALWFQFAQAIEHNSDFRMCAECAMWFELSPRTARTDKIYCSDACRMRAYRKRKSAPVS